MAYEERDAYDVVLGKVVAYLRQRRGWTQGQLASSIGVQQSAISRIENGVMSPDSFTFRRIAEVFGMTANDLQRRVDAAYERTQATVRQAMPSARGDLPWWQVALGLAGIVGLAGLAIFAVAAIFSEDRDDHQ